MQTESKTVPFIKAETGHPYDRIVREEERRFITSISRSQAWQLEQRGMFPKRIKLGNRSVGWRLSELTEWIERQLGENHEG